MRCFACDHDVTNVAKGHDRETDRYYCDPCFEPTNAVIYQNSEDPIDYKQEELIFEVYTVEMSSFEKTQIEYQGEAPF